MITFHPVAYCDRVRVSTYTQEQLANPRPYPVALARYAKATLPEELERMARVSRRALSLPFDQYAIFLDNLRGD